MTETLARIHTVLMQHRPINCATERVRCSCRHQWMSEMDYRAHLLSQIGKVL